MNFEVQRAHLDVVRIRDERPTPLGPGHARVRIDAFALTTNNITYAVFGDAMQYWNFFPSEEPSVWGRIPVWGFGEIVESTVDACAVGERVYGYWPMASELVVEPGRSDDRGFTDMAAHRAPMAGAYNRYLRVGADPIYAPDREAHQMVLYPLFFTSFLIDDFFAARDDLDTDQIIVSSASSKTAIGVAFLAHARGRRVVGLTSARNHAFVAGLGVYDEVVDYGDPDAISAGTSVFVDMAGNQDVVRAVHTQGGETLRHSMVVGGTHWDHAAAADGALPGPTPEFFFAPGQIARRTEEWGRDEFDRRSAGAWDAYSRWTDEWMRFETAAGPEAVQSVYATLLAGRADPSTGFIASLPSANS